MVDDFAYRLAVLTHGDAAPLVASLASFAANVTPAPTSVLVHHDNPTDAQALAWTESLALNYFGESARVLTTEPPGLGCCGSQSRVWADNAQAVEPYVFLLEGDFTFNRHVDLRDLASVLDTHPTLAQMALVRNAVKGEPPGGFIATARERYDEVWTNVDDTNGSGGLAWVAVWIAHRRNLTFNPSLWPTQFFATHVLPSHPGCEHVFTQQLAESDPDVEYGLWGSIEDALNGDVWCQHIGIHSGWGH